MSDAELAKQKEALATEIAGIEDKAGYKVIYDAHQVVKTTISDIEKIRVELKRTWSINPGKAIDAVAKKLDEDWTAVEAQLAAKRKVIDDEKARIAREEQEKKEKRQEERIKLLNGWGFVYDFTTKAYILDPENNPIAIMGEEVWEWDDEWVFFAGVAEQRYMANQEVARLKKEAEDAAQAEAARALAEANARAEAEKNRADDLQRQIDELKALIKPKEEEPKRTNLDLVAYAPRQDAEDVSQATVPQGDTVHDVPGATVIQKATEFFVEESANVGLMSTYGAYKEAGGIAAKVDPIESDEELNTTPATEEFTPTAEQLKFLNGIIEGGGAETMDEAIGYCITAVMSIEKRYDMDAYWMGDNDIRKPYAQALEEIYKGQPPKGKAFAVWARGIAQEVVLKSWPGSYTGE